MGHPGTRTLPESICETSLWREKPHGSKNRAMTSDCGVMAPKSGTQRVGAQIP
jgi:hypothetical protein